MYPKLKINLTKLRDNFSILKTIQNKQGISIHPVTKVCCGDVTIAKTLVEEGATTLCDSRVKNLEIFSQINCKKVLIRTPMISEISKVIEYSNLSFNSEFEIIKALNEEAKKKNKIHEIILVIELGDLREGILVENLEKTISKIINLSNISLVGLGGNLTCFNGVLPTKDKMETLIKLTKKLNSRFSINLKTISGGNSSSLSYLEANRLPREINELRIGEALFLGLETAFSKNIFNLHEDIFTLEAEIIELKTKPSLPDGEVGQNAFGEKPVFIDRGLQKRGILAIGREEVNFENLKLIDEELTIIGSSSDHMVIDFTKSMKEYKVGDIVKFKLNYSSLLRCFSSKYIKREYLK